MLILRRLRPDELPMADLTGRTIGALQLGTDTLYTIERPWVPGQHVCGKPFDSCIPAGKYRLVWRQSPSKGMRLHLVNEELGIYLEKWQRPEPWQRYSCMFHVANYVRNVEGCLGVGMSINNFRGADGWGVGQSSLALSRLEKYVQDHNVQELEIIDSRLTLESPLPVE